jgi:hypothetical protein
MSTFVVTLRPDDSSSAAVADGTLTGGDEDVLFRWTDATLAGTGTKMVELQELHFPFCPAAESATLNFLPHWGQENSIIARFLFGMRFVSWTTVKVSEKRSRLDGKPSAQSTGCVVSSPFV